MKPYLKHILEDTTTYAEGYSIIREYLQARILEILQRNGTFQSLSFHGGTALRFLYDIPRYSEDLDFALEGNREKFDFKQYLTEISKTFTAEGYDLQIPFKEKQPVVNKAFIRFRGLVHEIGISPHQDQVIAIKIEVDTHPPAGAESEITVVSRHADIAIRHHTKSTLIAGKLNAIFTREYIKGRDWFDIWWYLKQPEWPEPNIPFLNNGLQQANIPIRFTLKNWKTELKAKAESVDWPAIYGDVTQFIIRQEMSTEFDSEELLALLK